MTYEAMVDDWVRQSLARVSTFAALVQELPGVYPTEVSASLNRLGVNLPYGASELLPILWGPLPHPLDGDWRLHSDSHPRLLMIAKEQNAKNIVLLGCPSLVAPLVEIANVALVDTNQAWQPYIESLHVEACWGEVSSVLPQWTSRFDLVIADPPWYPQDFERFLAAAAALVLPGKRVVLCWPGEGTRPGIKEEWQNLVDCAARMHLRVECRERRALKYSTPFHEACALRAAGLPVLAAWRGSELAMFVREFGDVEHPKDEALKPWSTARFGSLNLRLRSKEIANRNCLDPRLIRLVDGDILPTVSRRDSRRDAAVVWTAGNRIFGCNRPDLLEAVVLGSADRVPAPHVLARVLGRELSQHEKQWAIEAELQLRTLEQIEAAEYDALHDPGHVPPC